MKATYHYKQFRYEKEPISISVPVEIISESEKTYMVKLLAPNVRGHKYGDIIRVKRHMVATPKPVVDCSNEWWND